MIEGWQRYRQRIRESDVPALLQVILWGILGLGLVLLWWGRPESVSGSSTNGGNLLLQRLYFATLYCVLFSCSRTVSVRQCLGWFCLGMTVIVAGAWLAQAWVFSWPIDARSELFGWWAMKDSVYHSSLTGPLIEDSFKLAPLLIFACRARRRSSLHSYTISDWALMGFMIGAGLGFGEDAMRMQRHVWGFDFSWPKSPMELLLPMARTNGSFELLGRSCSTVYGAHATAGGLLGLAVGLTVFLRRRGWSRGTWLVPVAVLAWVAMDHGLFNLSLGYTHLRELGIVRGLYAVTLGGRVTVWAFGAGMPVLAVCELVQLRRRSTRRDRGRLLDHLRICAGLVTAALGATWAALIGGLGQSPRWLIPVRIPCTVATGLLVACSALLDYLNAQSALAQARHSIAWREGL